MSQARFIIGDVSEVLDTLPDNSVDLVVTSPPYLSLRSYLAADDPAKPKEMGSEATPAAFIDALLDVTVKLRRVLAPHGSLCIELGDTYAGSGGAGGDYGPVGLRQGQPSEWKQGAHKYGDRKHKVDGWGPFADAFAGRVQGGGRGWPQAKSLALIPESFRWALAYGRNPFNGRETEPWIVRNVVRHFRPNPPVGALGDKVRPATSEWVVACADRSRYFDLDSVREVNHPERMDRQDAGPTPKHVGSDAFGSNDRLTRQGSGAPNPAGAPPLDWWADDDLEWRDAAGFIEPTAPYRGWTRTFRRVRVAADAADGGTQRTTSPDCPVHGSHDQTGPTPDDGGHAADGPSHTGHTDARPALEQLPGFAPTVQPHASSTTGPSSNSPVLPCAPAAIPHSTASSRTDPAPATSPACTPSAETIERTGDTSESPLSVVLQTNTPDRSTGADNSPNSSLSQSAESTGGTETVAANEACTCSYWKTITQSTSHYATFSPKVVARLIKPMCPERVCRVCGEPSRRVVGNRQFLYADGRERPDDVPFNSGSKETGRSRALGFDTGVSSVSQTLGWSNCGCEECTCEGHSHRGVFRCMCCCCDLSNHWRPGLVLDPFAGSGTTLSVATGHGRDAIGIDLDARNADLAVQRCGMWLTVEHHDESEVVA